jgi:3'(2'), 5'-bisphosphate nucleotidase
MDNINIEKIIEIVREAGKIAMYFYSKKYFVRDKKDKTPVTEADLEINNFLSKELIKFGYPILSEENDNTFEKRKKSKYSWVIDPIDGTSDFIQKTGEFSIMLGLINKKGESVLGVVYAPALDELYFAKKGGGAYLIKNGKKVKIEVNKKDFKNGTILVSRNHLGKYEQEIAIKHNMKQLPMGSSGLKICRIARGDAQLYINSSDKSGIWDICAGDVIIKESNGCIVDLNKKNIISYNEKEIILKFGYIALNNFIFLENGNINIIL